MTASILCAGQALALNVGVGIGGIGAGVSIGGNGGGLNVGVGANVGGSAGVSAGAGVGIGGTSGVSAGASVGVGGTSGVGVGVGVGVGGTGVATNDGTGTGTNTGDGSGTGTPGITENTPRLVRTDPRGLLPPNMILLIGTVVVTSDMKAVGVVDSIVTGYGDRRIRIRLLDTIQARNRYVDVVLKTMPGTDNMVRLGMSYRSFVSQI